MNTVTLSTSDTARRTTVEEGTELTGSVESSCAIAVNGTIRGTVRAPEVSISRLGTISGSIQAERFMSSGTLSGSVEAAYVRLTGLVQSQTRIKTDRLEAMLHSQRGQLQVRFGSPPPEPSDSDLPSSGDSDEGSAPPLALAPSPGKARRGRRFHGNPRRA